MDEVSQSILPAGWCKSSIGEITLSVWKVDPLDDPEREIEYIDISSIDNVRNVVGEAKRFRLEDAPSRARQILRTGDVLFATVRPYLRNIAAVPAKFDGKIASTGFAVLRPARGIEPRFLFYKSTSTDFVNALSVEQYGVSYPAVTDDQVREQLILVPPYNEQLRIVTKIDELFSGLDKGVENLKIGQEQLRVYRHAILKYAFEGKLTATWREDNKDKLKTTEALLAGIRSEREVRSARSVKRRASKPFSDFSSNEQERLPELPFGWAWAKVGYLFEVVSGATPKGIEGVGGGDIPYYKISDMNTPGNETKMNVAVLNLSEMERDDLGLTSYPAGTVIFPKRGGAILTNKKRLLSKPSCFDLNTMGVFNMLPSISCDYLWQWFQKLDLSGIYDGSNVPQINNKNVEPLAFPFCSFEEQREIVKTLEERLSIIDRLAIDIELEIKKAEALRQSILRKAFSGALVAQDANDEPASVLLERIRDEKAETANGKKKMKRRAIA